MVTSNIRPSELAASAAVDSPTTTLHPLPPRESDRFHHGVRRRRRGSRPLHIGSQQPPRLQPSRPDPSAGGTAVTLPPAATTQWREHGHGARPVGRIPRCQDAWRGLVWQGQAGCPSSERTEGRTQDYQPAQACDKRHGRSYRARDSVPAVAKTSSYYQTVPSPIAAANAVLS